MASGARVRRSPSRVARVSRASHLHTDGACSGNPGPGGWGVILVYGDHERTLSGSEPKRVTLAEAAVLARHANATVTGAIYAGVSETAKAKIASKLVDAGFGS